MYSIKIDTVNGDILGLDDIFIDNLSDNWFTTDKECYDYILENNGKHIVDVTSVASKLETYKEEYFKFKTKQIKEITFIAISKDNLKEPDLDLNEIKVNRKEKNNTYCNMYIENGISYTFEDGTSKRYSFKEEDQLNFNELRNLINEGLFSEEDLLPLKANEESEYDLISIKIFKEIHNRLIKNKYYQLFYLRQMNEYVDSLTSVNDIHRLQYETNLPEKYINIINNQMKPFEKL